MAESSMTFYFILQTQPSHVAHSSGDFQTALFLVCSLYTHGHWRLLEDLPVIEQHANNARWKLKQTRVGAKGRNRET